MSQRTRCVPGAHLVRKSNVQSRTIEAELILPYKHVCMLKDNANDDVDIDQQVPICSSCWLMIQREASNSTEVAYNMDQDNIFPYLMPELPENVCFLCEHENPLYTIPFPCRVDFFIKTGIFIPADRKCCREHIEPNERQFKIDVHFLRVRATQGIVSMKPNETANFLTALRTASGTSDKDAMQNRILDMNNDDFRQVTGVQKDNFRDMCNVASGFKMKKLTCTPRCILLLLMKLRNCQYLTFLKALFGYESKRSVSAQIKIARIALKEKFVPIHLGPTAHPRPGSLCHVNDLSKRLHLSPENNENAVIVTDATYVFIPKSSNFTVLKRSYSQHKGRHLLKMNMYLFPDGHIFDAHGPYLSDGKNNDASTMKYELQKNIYGLKNWLIPGDVFVVDRGYRDAVEYLRELGFEVSIPFCTARRSGQVPTRQANDSRITTKTRWIVEARNGHVSQIFKYFGRSIHAGSVPFVGDYFRICCAIINAYYPTITLSEQSVAAGTRMLELRSTSNHLQEYLQEKGLLDFKIRRVWRNMEDEELEDFPRVDEDGLYSLTLSVFQMNLAPSYVAAQDFQFQVYKEEPDLLRVKTWSRHSLSTFYFVFIRFIPNAVGPTSIVGWYCSCKGGARTVGMCSHTCAILWYLCYARYNPYIKTPSNRVLEVALDAAERYAGIDVVEATF